MKHPCVWAFMNSVTRFFANPIEDTLLEASRLRYGQHVYTSMDVIFCAHAPSASPQIAWAEPQPGKINVNKQCKVGRAAEFKPKLLHKPLSLQLDRH